MALALPAFLCLAPAFLLVCLSWPRRSPIFSDLLLKLFLSFGFGLGIFSVVFFLSLLLHITRLVLLDLGVLALFLVSLLLFRTRSSHAVETTTNTTEPASWFHRLLAVAFAIALGAALYAAVMRTLAYPNGDGWDAFSIWNLHARFLFLGGLHWRDGFSPLIPWSHPDYPVLLPAAIAHFWAYFGHDTPTIPCVIGLALTFSTVGLLFSALSILRGRTAALLGAIVLLTTPSFIQLGTSQYADEPLSFFMLATVGLLCLHDNRAQQDRSNDSFGLLALAGLAIGFAAWTKNEGLLFLCAILMARFVVLARREHRPRISGESGGARFSRLAPVLLAAAPVLLLVIYFKHAIAPPGDLFSDLATIVHKLLSPPRYWAVIKWYVKEFFRFGRWLLIPVPVLMLGYYFALGEAKSVPHSFSFRVCRLALALALAGYFAIYIITPYDIYWHLRFSLDRLFLQLWPSTIFLFFLSVPLPEKGRGSATPAGGS